MPSAKQFWLRAAMLVSAALAAVATGLAGFLALAGPLAVLRRRRERAGFERDLAALQTRLRTESDQAQDAARVREAKLREQSAQRLDVLRELARDPRQHAYWLPTWLALEDNSLPVTREPFLLERVLEASCGALRVEIPAGLPSRWIGDAQHLERLLAALAENADQGELFVSTAQPARGELRFRLAAETQRPVSPLAQRLAAHVGAKLSSTELIFPVAPWPTPQGELSYRMVLIGEGRAAADYLAQISTAWGYRCQWIPNPQDCWDSVENLILENDPATVLLIGATEDPDLGESLAAAAQSSGGSRLFVLGDTPASSSGFIPRPLDRYHLYLALALAGVRPQLEAQDEFNPVTQPMREMRILAVSPQLWGEANARTLARHRAALATGQNRFELTETLKESLAIAQSPARPNLLLWPATREALEQAKRLRTWENDRLQARLPLFALAEPQTPPGADAWLAAGFDALLPYPFRLSDLAEAAISSVAECSASRSLSPS
jgi:hypothetical protein